MEELSGFWRKWNKFIVCFVVFSLLISILLTGELNEFHLSFLLIPITYLLCNKFYFGSIRINNNQFYIQLFFCSIVVRLLSIFFFSYILTQYVGIPFLSYKDDYVYNEVAKEILERWRSSGFGFYSDIRLSTGFYSGFPNFSALLMYVFGDSIYVPRIGNAVLSSFTCVYAYSICRQYATESQSRLVGILFMFSPLLYVFSAVQLKDTVLIFLIFGAISAASKIIVNKGSYKNIVGLVLFLVGMIFFRAASIIPILGAFLLTYFYYSTFLKRYNKLVPVLVFGLVIFGVIYGWSFFSTLESVESPEFYFESRYEGMASKSIENSSAGIANSSIAKFIGTPLYLLAGMFLPPPLLVSLPDQETINYSQFGLIFHFSLLPFLIGAIFNVIKGRKTMVIPFFILITFMLFKMGQASALLSILNPRQSLASIFLMYLLLPIFFTKMEKRKTSVLVIGISMLIMFIYAVVRLMSRDLL